MQIIKVDLYKSCWSILDLMDLDGKFQSQYWENPGPKITHSITRHLASIRCKAY